MNSLLARASGVCVLSMSSLSVYAISISGQGTWESTLLGRDLDGDASTFEAYYDTALDITWLANTNVAGLMSWSAANAWAAGLDVNGVTGWRLPTNTPINGSTFDTTASTDGTTDNGTATTTTDGSDGGWRDAAGNPVSEMGHMFYVTLGNVGQCDPALPWCTQPAGYGITNTGPFSIFYFHSWSAAAFDATYAYEFSLVFGSQFSTRKSQGLFALAVHPGDVGAVPIPAAVWLFGGGLIGLVVLGQRRKPV
jgi:hypothetical protein